MWHAGFWGFGFLCVVILLVVVGLIARMVFFRRFGSSCGPGPFGRGPWSAGDDHEAILKRRLAAGEITEEEYQHVRDVLRR